MSESVVLFVSFVCFVVTPLCSRVLRFEIPQPAPLRAFRIVRGNQVIANRPVVHTSAAAIVSTAFIARGSIRRPSTSNALSA